MHMRVINGKEVELTVLLKLKNELWPHYGLESLKQQISDLVSFEDEFLYVRFKGNSPAGLIELTIRNHAPGGGNARVLYLEGWCVSSEYTCMGYGRRLIAFAQEWAKEQGYRALASLHHTPITEKFTNQLVLKR